MLESDGSLSSEMIEVLFAEQIAVMLCVVEVDATPNAVKKYLNNLVPYIVEEMRSPYGK